VQAHAFRGRAFSQQGQEDLALVLAGKLTPEQAMDRMKVSGTAKEYTGLWAAVQNARPIAARLTLALRASMGSVDRWCLRMARGSPF